MTTNDRKLATITLTTLILMSLVALAVAAAGEVPGWFKAGNDPKGYEIGTTEVDGDKVAYIRSLDADPKKFGTLMQSFDADQYRGQRIQLTAKVRTVDVKNWVGMWMRVDVGTQSVSFDNMQERALKGTTDWTECRIVLDVPDNADKVALGLILAGDGRAEWDSIKFETVSKDVPLTGKSAQRRQSGPSNLNFEN